MKKILSILLATVMFFTLASCNQLSSKNSATSANSSQGTRVITDALGRKVKIPAKVNKVVALSNVPRMIVYLGLADKVVGYSGMESKNITPLTAYAYVTKDTWKDVPIVGTDAGGNTDYYPEKIISVHPDVIICCYAEDAVKNLESQTGIPVVSVSMGNLFEEDYNQSLRTIGKICGVEDRAEEVISYIKSCLSDLKKGTADIPKESKHTVLSAAATFKGVHGIEGVRIKDQVLASLNALDVASKNTKDNNSTAVEVDKEQILKWNADYIFCDYGGVKLVKNDIKANPGFYNQLKAYKDHHIYQYPSSTSYYSNLEIPLANCYYVGSVLYPDKFADIDITKKSNEIFKFFLGVDDYMSVLHKYGADYGPVELGDKK